MRETAFKPRSVPLTLKGVYINSTIGALSDIATKGSQEPAQQNQQKRTAKPRRMKA
jgi:hypothetical protein